MKKILFIVLSACLLCSFVSCNNEVKAKSKEVYELLEITVKDEDLQTASAKAVLAQLNSLYSTVNLMLDNGLEVPEQAKGMGESNIDFMDLICYTLYVKKAEMRCCENESSACRQTTSAEY